MNNTTSKSSQLVWYASYGSNMDQDRFHCYIAGGTPLNGRRHYIGCTDKTLPSHSVALDLPQSLYFSGESKVWTGGIAFITHAEVGQPTKSRAYLITLEQFEQVVAQESRRTEPITIDIPALRQQGHILLGDGSGAYDKLIYCKEKDDYPIITFTSPEERQPYTKPAKVYLRMIGQGLIKAHRMTADEVASYLVAAPGVKDQYTVSQLIEIIR